MAVFNLMESQLEIIGLCIDPSEATRKARCTLSAAFIYVNLNECKSQC